MKDDKGFKCKAALAPGTMIPAAGEPWEEMTVPRPGGGCLTGNSSAGAGP